jgi:hypothetical protein
MKLVPDDDLQLHILNLPEVILFVQCWFLAAIVHCDANDWGGRCDHHHIFHTCQRIITRISVAGQDPRRSLYVLDMDPVPERCF